MARLFSNRDRPFDLGVLPTERLPRAMVEPNSLLAVAVFFGQTRLIDNIQLR